MRLRGDFRPPLWVQRHVASGDIRQMYKAPPGRVLETRNVSEFRLQDLEATESPGMSSVTSCA